MNRSQKLINAFVPEQQSPPAFVYVLCYVVIDIVAERKNFKLLFSVGIVLWLGFRIYIFRPIRMIHTILPG